MRAKWDLVFVDNAPRHAIHVRQQAGRIVAKTARDVEASAKDGAAVDTGFMKNSIRAVPVGPFTWLVFVSAEYAIYVEFGTRNAAAQPFFIPAVEKHRQAFMRAMQMVTAGPP